MPRTEQANQEIRRKQQEKILNSARSVFERKGNAITMADIAAEAGISQGLAYRYFSSKETILTTLAQQAAESSSKPLERLGQIQGTPAARLETLVTYLIDDIKENPGHYQFINQLLADNTIPAEFQAVIQKNRQATQDAIKQLIIEAQATGEVAQDDPEMLLAALMSCFDGLLKRASLYPQETNISFPDAKIVLRMLKPEFYQRRNAE